MGRRAMSTTLTSDAAESSTQPSGKRPLVIGGIIVILVGAIAAALLAWAANQRHSNAVEGLARGPVNCDTTLDFSDTGEFFVFVETAGDFGDLAGNCGATGEYRLDRPDPAVDLEVVDPDGDVIAIDAAADLDYDAAGFTGSVVGVIDVDQTGAHVLRASSPDGQFAVAVGRDPDSGVGALRTFAVVALLVGLVLGALLLVLGFRHTAPAAASVAPGRTPFDGTWSPTPSGPPHAHPGTAEAELPEPPQARPLAPPPIGVPGEPSLAPQMPVASGPPAHTDTSSWSPPTGHADSAPAAPPLAAPPLAAPGEASDGGSAHDERTPQPDDVWSEHGTADTAQFDVEVTPAEPTSDDDRAQPRSPWAPPSV